MEREGYGRQGARYAARYFAASFGTLGTAADQNILTIELPTAIVTHDVIAVIDTLHLTQLETTQITTGIFQVRRTTAVPTGGTVLTAAREDSRDIVVGRECVVRGATASNFGVATAITATPTGGFFGTYHGVFPSLGVAAPDVGAILPMRYSLLNRPVVLRRLGGAAEALVVHGTHGVSSSVFVCVSWLEYVAGATV